MILHIYKQINIYIQMGLYVCRTYLSPKYVKPFAELIIIYITKDLNLFLVLLCRSYIRYLSISVLFSYSINEFSVMIKDMRSYISDWLSVGLVDAALQCEVERAAGDHQSLPELLIKRLDRSRIPKLHPGTPQNLQHKASQNNNHIEIPNAKSPKNAIYSPL